MKLLFLLFAISFLIQQIYHWYFFSAFSFYRSSAAEKDVQFPVSVVICAKNEEENLRELIPALFKQNAEEFEIVIVDDHSTDQTASLLQELKPTYPLTIVKKEEVPERKGKKFALSAGIDAATHSRILVTDADCRPTSEEWIKKMTLPLKQADVVLGVAPNMKEFSFIKNFFRFETYLTALQYISYARRNTPYMGVGRNMAYTKKFFLTYFEEVLKIDTSSGDDDLLINLADKELKTTVVLDKKAMTLSKTPLTWKSWWKQKTRHLSTGFHYKPLHQLLLSLFPATAILFLVTTIILFFTPLKSFAMIALLGYYFTLACIHSFGLRKINSADLVLEAPFYFILWSFLVPFISLSSAFKKNQAWK